MSKFFSIDELKDKPAAAPESGILVEKFIDLHCRKLETVKELSGRLPQHGEVFFLWTLNSFNAFTFIPLVLKERGIIDELVVSTYSINTRIVNSFMRYVDKGLIRRVDMLISDSIKYRAPHIYDLLSSLVNHRNDIISVNYSWNHAKISLMNCGNDHFVVEGSGNWGENSRHEQYIFINSQKVYEFRKTEIYAAR